MKDVSKHYDILTPQERLILTVEAMGRGDIDERDRLTESCPKKSYLMNDGNYSMAYSRLMDLALCNLVSSYRALAKANMASGAIACGCDDMLAAYAVYTTNRLSFQEAWKRFCGSIGLDGNKVFAALGFDVADLQIPPVDDGIVADEESVAIIFEGMASSWDAPM